MSIINPKWFLELKSIYKSDGIKGLFKKGVKSLLSHSFYSISFEIQFYMLFLFI